LNYVASSQYFFAETINILYRSRTLDINYAIAIFIKRAKFIYYLPIIHIMDLIDKKILCELDANCRTPISQLAKKLRIGRNVAAYRIQKLEKEGIIAKYVCSINLGKLGYKTHKIYIKTTTSSPAIEKEFVEYIIKSNKTIHFLKLEGFYDYSITIVTKQVIELDEFITDIKSRYKNFIKDYAISIHVYSRIFKFDKIILDQKIGALKFEKYNEEQETYIIDEKDHIILNEISQKANESIIDISKNTKLSPDIVKYRMKNLKKTINAFRAIFDFNKLEYYQYTVLLKTPQMTKEVETRLFGWASIHKNILYYNKRIGYFDFEITIVIKSIDELNNFLKGLKNEFSEYMTSYEILLNTELIKLDYYPFNNLKKLKT
jgi:DNA-binding Lrp family transcriptional regulator